MVYFFAFPFKLGIPLKYFGSKHWPYGLLFEWYCTCQALIAVSMLLKGWLFKSGAIGAIILLLAIAPLGVGSAFPCTVTLAIAMWILERQKQADYLWVSHVKKIAVI